MVDAKLTELQSLQEFYDNLGSENRGYGLNALAGHSQDMDSNAEGKSAEDECLQRIEHLESLLQADRSRKTKFQKPEKQRQWEEELEQLWRQLD